jgi:hypothetical protein
VKKASTSSALAVYGMLPTYSRRPSEMACGTWGAGLVKAAREVLVREGEGDEGCRLSVFFVRQLGELKARPLVRTPAWKGERGAGAG